MKKTVILMSLFLLGTAFLANAQEMTPKEKTGYAIGAFLGEKIKSSGIEMSIIQNLNEAVKEKVDFEFLKEGIRDILKGEIKLEKEELEAIFKEIEAKIEQYKQLFESVKNSGNEGEKENQR